MLEREKNIGGVWCSNEYPGLRLHGPGAVYRCLSLAPRWTKEHDASEWYRPFRAEIMEYVKELADHPHIRIVTGCSYSGHARAANGLFRV